jgi:hypothetical protein
MSKRGAKNGEEPTFEILQSVLDFILVGIGEVVNILTFIAGEVFAFPDERSRKALRESGGTSLGRF